MATSKTAICNLALTALGAQRITSLDQDLKEARTCKALFDECRDAVLAAHEWNCATARAELAADSTAPAFGYLYRYLMPSNPYCLKVRTIEGEDTYPWEVVGRYIETDNPAPLQITYTKQVTDPTEFDPLFRQALAARLAAEMAYILTADTKLESDMWAKYHLKLMEARTGDAKEGSVVTEETSSWITARND